MKKSKIRMNTDSKVLTWSLFKSPDIILDNMGPIYIFFSGTCFSFFSKVFSTSLGY